MLFFKLCPLYSQPVTLLSETTKAGENWRVKSSLFTYCSSEHAWICFLPFACTIVRTLITRDTSDTTGPILTKSRWKMHCHKVGSINCTDWPKRGTIVINCMYVSHMQYLRHHWHNLDFNWVNESCHRDPSTKLKWLAKGGCCITRGGLHVYCCL